MGFLKQLWLRVLCASWRSGYVGDVGAAVGKVAGRQVCYWGSRAATGCGASRRPPLGSRTAVLGTGLAPPPFGTLCAGRWGRHLALAVGTTWCCGGLVPAHSRCSVHPLHTVAAPVKAQPGQREGGQPYAPAGGPGRG